MTTPLPCLLGYAGWAIALVLALAVVRVSQVLAGTKRPNEFPSGVPHGSDREWRLNRAHVNCLENLPVFAAVVLVGAVLSVESPTLDRLAIGVLAARVGQSLVHIASGSSLAVNARFTFFGTQIVCLVWMAIHTLGAASS